MILIRLIILPFALAHLILNVVFTLVFWLLDPTYDHDAAIHAVKEGTNWINKFNN